MESTRDKYWSAACFKRGTIATTTIDVTRLTDNPFIGAAMGIIMGMAVDEGGNEVAKTMTKDLLKTDAQKWKNKRKVKND